MQSLPSYKPPPTLSGSSDPELGEASYASPNSSAVMVSFNKTLTLLIGLCLFAMPHLAAAQPVQIWLVLVVDRSGSIDDDELRLQRNAYVEILRDPGMTAAFANAQIAIVEFDNTAEVAVGWSSARVAADLYAAYAPVAPRGGTAIGRGLQTALELLDGKSGDLIIDVSGDGRDNRDQILLEESKSQAIKAGIEINGLIFDGRANGRVTRYFEEKVITGFTLTISSLNDFADALRRKLQRELNLASGG